MNPSGAQAPDVFVSYARKNRPVAEQLAEGLSASGLQVWWDSELSAGSEFAAVIETKLQGAAVVIVLWSADSVRSSFVRDECSRALKHDKLLPVRIEDIELPLGFGQLHTLDLLEWEGDADDEAFEKLLLEVRRRRQQRGHAPRRLLSPLPTPRPGFGWPRPVTLLTALLVLVFAAGAVTWYVRDLQEQKAIEQREALARAEKQAREEARRIEANKIEAERHFRAGLDLQIADVPQLEKALNEYLSAIERVPAHARAHYYLGHVYAQTGRGLDALVSFKLALAGTEAPLDRSQRAVAEKQVLALAVVEGEEAPVTRAAGIAEPAPAPAPRVSAAGSGGPDRGVAVAAAPSPRPPTASADTEVLTRSIKTKPAAGAAGAAARPAPAVVAAVPSPVAPREPPRIESPEAAMALLAKSVDGLFDANKETRITATTSLVLDPQALSDAVPIAVARAVKAAGAGPSGMNAAASSGVVNTLVLLQSALPGTLRVNRAAIEELLAAALPLGDYTALQAGKVRELMKQSAARHPLAYIQIANEAQRPIAEALALKMRSFGYDAPGIELVGNRAPEVTQLRVQGKSDRSYARWVRKVLAEAVNAQPAVSALRNAKPGVDTYEIWLGRLLCAPGGRVLASCKPA
ncbi:MAG: TIR domain-containing protein [Burkholderiales bacterium]